MALSWKRRKSLDWDWAWRCLTALAWVELQGNLHSSCLQRRSEVDGASRRHAAVRRAVDQQPTALQVLLLRLDFYDSSA